jgi:hypothetical protein
MIKFIDFSAKSGTNRVKNTYMDCSGFVFWDVKREIFDKMLEKGSKENNK